MRPCLSATALLTVLFIGCIPSLEAGESPSTLSDTTSVLLPAPPGPLVIIGGGRLAENEVVYRAILDRREGDGPVCVIPTANDDIPTALARGTGDLNRYGGDGAAIAVDLGIHNAKRAFDPALAADLRTCSGFFFEGGQQFRILQVFRPGGASTPAYEAIADRFRSGAVVAGTSAGAAMMSESMIRGGTSILALEKGVGDPDTDAGVIREMGMGFLAGAVIDQHFMARGRVGRLLVTLLDTSNPPVGLGIDEQTALVIDSTRAQVIGASSVVLLDARQAQREDGGGGWLGIRMQVLGSGDELNLTTGSIARSSDKQMLPLTLGSVTVLEDIFQPLAFLQLVITMARTPLASVTLPAGGRNWMRIGKETGFQAMAFDSVTSYQPFDGGVAPELTEMPAGFSSGPFTVDILRRSP